MIEREEYLKAVRERLKANPVVMLLGPRQVGKSTLAQQLLAPNDLNYLDLELPEPALLMNDPYTNLKDRKGLVVIDEAQRVPALFPVLRGLADRPRKPARFLLLGSASPELSRQANESLAGRVAFVDISGFGVAEVGLRKQDQRWLRGGFPRSFLARSDPKSMDWRMDFVRTFVERDLGVLGFNYPAPAMARFWTLLSHYHGQIWNAAEAAATMGVTAKTVNRYLDALEQTFMVRRVLPWYENVGKRIVKSPKIYFRDSGLFHALQRIGTMRDLQHHPKFGASWEGFVMEEIVSTLKLRDFYFYNVHSGTELDMFFLHKGKRIGVEIKREDAPRMTRSMHVALADLRLDKLRVVYPGSRRYSLSPKVECVPFADIAKLI
jgi:predicted AAA+ superfamily ATPase